MPSKPECRSEETDPRVIPGMRSDSEPQPHEDPDFGPDMDYESGDVNTDSKEADQIRKQWTQEEKQDTAEQWQPREK